MHMPASAALAIIQHIRLHLTHEGGAREGTPLIFAKAASVSGSDGECVPGPFCESRDVLPARAWLDPLCLMGLRRAMGRYAGSKRA